MDLFAKVLGIGRRFASTAEVRTGISDNLQLFI